MQEQINKRFTYSRGAITRGDTTTRKIALVFTGDEFAEGASFIASTLKQQNVKASFFFTGRFYRNQEFAKSIQLLKNEKHYLGAHSDQHLLYCDWTKRDSLLVTKRQFNFDLADNYTAMARHGIDINKARYFLPPYEWYNDTIAAWTKELKLQLINFTPGTRSHADYTVLSDKNYRSSEEIYNSILKFEESVPSGLNGFLLLMHIGAGANRPDKFYKRLPELLKVLKSKGYQFQTVDKMLSTD
jgi:endoglucanase